MAYWKRGRYSGFFGGSYLFYAFRLSQVYYQVELDEQSRKVTAFTTEVEAFTIEVSGK